MLRASPLPPLRGQPWERRGIRAAQQRSRQQVHQRPLTATARARARARARVRVRVKVKVRGRNRSKRTSSSLRATAVATCQNLLNDSNSRQHLLSLIKQVPKIANKSNLFSYAKLNSFYLFVVMCHIIYNLIIIKIYEGPASKKQENPQSCLVEQ
jgi:hypothetical protein